MTGIGLERSPIAYISCNAFLQIPRTLNGKTHRLNEFDTP